MIQLITRLSFLIAMVFSIPSFAVDPVYTKLFSDNAIRGYDTVAYFTQNKAIEGKDEFAFEYKDATWLFSTQEHLDLFKENPEKYEPQYGGYCAYAVSQNKTASIQPDLFTIHDDKLYLNYSRKINDKWLENKEKFIEKADIYWPEILAD